jgi:hypothetical protein
MGHKRCQNYSVSRVGCAFRSARNVIRDIAKEAFNPVHPRAGCRGEMHVDAFVPLKPGLHFRVFMRGVVVHDQMQLELLGRFSIDLLEKLQPFLMPVLASMELIKRP